jgi:hypothetical protein
MANVLQTEKKIAIIAALTEGSSIRSVERMTDDGPKRHVTVLHVHPATTPIQAVRAALLQEYRDANPA